MAESDQEFDRRFWLLPAGLLVAAVAVALWGHLSREKIAEEVFTALVEVLIGVGVVGTAISWDRDRRRARAHKMAIVSELAAVRLSITDALVLMETNQSARTWKTQVSALLALRDRLTALRQTMSILERDGYAPYAAEFGRHITSAEERLADLQTELKNKEGLVAEAQRTFEKAKDAGEHPDRARHWKSLLALVPETCALVETDGAPLIDELRNASHPIRADLAASG